MTEIRAMKDFFGDEEYQTIWDKIRYKYYDLVPYDWRPKNIYYYLKCYFFKKYNVVKVKTLPPTWCDRDHLLLHTNFQILTDFFEKEKPFEWFDIENSPNKKGWYELKELYDWWKKCMEHPDQYRSLLDPDFHELDQILSQKVKDEEERPAKFIPERFKDGKPFTYVYKTFAKDEQKYHDYIMAGANLEVLHEQFLDNQLIRLIKLRKMLWT